MFRIVSATVNPDNRPQAERATGSRWTAALRLGIAAGVIVAAVVFAWRGGYFELDQRRHLAESAARVHALRWSETMFVVIYAVAISVMLPAAVMTLLGGAVFGAWEGAVLAWLGAMLGTCLAHILARRVLRSAIQRMLGKHQLLRRLRERADVMALFRLRILPVAPFATLDYLAGVAGVALTRVLAATAIGVIPSVVAYSYVGAELMRGMRAGEAASHRALWVAGAVTAAMMILSTLPMLLRRLRD